jgi:hypothetical protein
MNATTACKFKKITVGELLPGDLISFDGKTFFLFRKTEVIGAGLECIRYSSNKIWRSYDRVIRSNKKVFVAPFGRHYQSS